MDDPRIDEAINSFPLAELPKGFISRTMERIANQRASISFRLNFIDIALPAFFSTFLLVLIGGGLWGYNQIDPRWFQYVQLEIVHYFESIPSSSVGYQTESIILLALVFFLFSALMVIWVISRPPQIRVMK